MATHLGETIYRLRTDKGLSQQQLANKLYVSRSAVANWEAGNRMPDAAMISQIARALNTDAAELLTAAENPDETPTILLLDDSPIALEGGLSVLREAFPNAYIIGFSSPIEALEHCEKQPVALAFLDIELGRSSGLDLCQELLRVRPDANVVFLTAYPEYSLDAWSTSSSGFLLKPLEIEEARGIIPRLRHPVRGLL